MKNSKKNLLITLCALGAYATVNASEPTSPDITCAQARNPRTELNTLVTKIREKQALLQNMADLLTEKRQQGSEDTYAQLEVQKKAMAKELADLQSQLRTFDTRENAPVTTEPTTFLHRKIEATRAVAVKKVDKQLAEKFDLLNQAEHQSALKQKYADAVKSHAQLSANDGIQKELSTIQDTLTALTKTIETDIACLRTRKSELLSFSLESLTATAQAQKDQKKIDTRRALLERAKRETTQSVVSRNMHTRIAQVNLVEEMVQNSSLLALSANNSLPTTFLKS